MHELTKLIKDDMRPALGVTEPGAIAYAVSKARSYLTGELKEVRLLLNSGMYKNAYTCGIPNSLFFGNEYAAALGALAGRPEKELESLADVTEADNAAAEALVKAGRIHVEMSGITSRIFIEAQVRPQTAKPWCGSGTPIPMWYGSKQTEKPSWTGRSPRRQRPQRKRL